MAWQWINNNNRASERTSRCESAQVKLTSSRYPADDEEAS